MNIEVKHLRTVTAIRDYGTLARAADFLCLTQSALSHQIKELEQKLGLSLYHRHGRSLHLTQTGKQLLALAERVLPEFYATQQRLQHMESGHSGRLHIAIECHSCFDWLMPTVESYRSAWPDVEIDITLAHSFDPLPALLRGDIDLLISSDPHDLAEVQYFPLFRYEAKIVMQARHHLAQCAWIRPADLQAETLITYPVETQRLDIYRRFLQPQSITPDKVRSVELTSMILQLVASGRGVAALPNWAVADAVAKGQIVARKIGEQGQWANLYCGVRQQDSELTYVEQFIELARRISFQNLQGITTVTE